MNSQITFIYKKKKNFINAEKSLDEFIITLTDECDIELKDNEQILLTFKNGTIIKDNDDYLQYINIKHKDLLIVEIIDKNKFEKLIQEENKKKKNN